MTEPARELSRRRRVFGSCVRRAQRAERAAAFDDALFWAATAAAVAYQHPSAAWHDRKLEQMIERVAAELAPAVLTRVPGRAEPDERQVAYVHSGARDAGGHIQALLDWMRLLAADFEQHVISSELVSSPVTGPAALAEMESRTQSTRLAPAGSPPGERVLLLARWLCELAPGRIVMFIEPDDAIAVCAVHVARRLLGPSALILFFNHADHGFSLGIPVADRVIHFRRAGAEHSITHRGLAPDRVRIVPLGSRPRHYQWLSRRALGIAEGVTLSLTIAPYHKLVPDGYWHFGEIVRDLLAAERDHLHLMVGLGMEAHRMSVVRACAALPAEARTRLRWLGPRYDVDDLLQLVDFVIESCPLRGGTGALDAARMGRPVVAITNSRWPLLAASDTFGDDYELRARYNDDVVALSRRLIADPALREAWGRRLQRRYEDNFSASAVAAALGTAFASRSAPAPVERGAAAPFEAAYIARLGDRVPTVAAARRAAQLRLGYPRRDLADRVLIYLDHANDIRRRRRPVR